jgi:hypothetical protein
VVRREDRARRTLRIQSSLRALGNALVGSSRRLDAVVVSGDVTDRGAAGGFTLLEPTLDELGGALPDRSQIMVVPGNHDVIWYTGRSSRERYQNFLEGVRNAGFRTPLLEGIDTDTEGNLRPDAVDPVVLTAGGRIAILGLNTTDYCGVEEYPTSEVATAVADFDLRFGGDPAWQTIRADWRRRGGFDLARLGAHQRRWGAHLLTKAIEGVSRPVLRVAVIHHQLLPVSTDEEVKPFEALLNLGQAREFFATNNSDVLMHGHKHTAALYEDRYGNGVLPRTHTLIVCSARTVGKGQSSGGEIAKLLEIDTGLPTITRIAVRSIPARDEGGVVALEQITPERIFTVSGGEIASGIFAAATAAAVHEQLIDAFRGDTMDVARPVICRIDIGPSARMIPDTYPAIPGCEPQQRQAWFTDMATRWQSPRPGRGMDFNHGQRLRHYRHDLDQIERVIQVLSARTESSRALAVLVNPLHDPIGDLRARFPAFTLAQFLVSDAALHVVAYFRKQEMRYWWPINAAELSALQEEVLNGLNDNGVSITAGSIVTITALPIAGRSVPRVSLPLIDRIADEDHEAMLRHTAALVADNVPGRAETLHWWNSLFDDWYPGAEAAPDGDPDPIFGLTVLSQTVSALAQAFEVTNDLQGIIDRINHLTTANTLYREQQRVGHSPAERLQWAENTRRDIDRLRALIVSRLTSSTDD